MSKKKKRNSGKPVQRNRSVQHSPPKVPRVEAKVSGVALAQQISEEFSGPIPPPAMLAEYERVHPGLAERIIRTVEIPLEMAQEQQLHRHGLEDKVITSDVRRSWAGLALGFVLSSLAIGGGIYLITQDKSVEGLASIVMALGVLVAAFYQAGQRRKRELRDSKPD